MELLGRLLLSEGIVQRRGSEKSWPVSNEIGSMRTVEEDGSSSSSFSSFPVSREFPAVVSLRRPFRLFRKHHTSFLLSNPREIRIIEMIGRRFLIYAKITYPFLFFSFLSLSRERMKLINNLARQRLILSYSNTKIRAEFPRKCLRKEKFKKFLIDEAKQGRIGREMIQLWKRF